VEQFSERVVTPVEDDPPGVVDGFAAFEFQRFAVAERQQDPGEVRVDLRE